MLKYLTSKLIAMTITVSTLSYWICLFVAIICLFLALCGSKAGKVGVTSSVIIYTVIQCVISVLLS